MFGRVGPWALILLLWIHSALTVPFQISCLQLPIVVEAGTSTVLECQLIPKLNIKEMEVRWTKGNALVHLYRFGQDENAEQDARFKDRTQLFANEFQNGNVSLKLTKVELKDEGEYKCLVDTPEREYQDAIVTLNVASLGEMPSVNLVKYLGNGIQLLCESDSWYPTPTVEWKDGEGKALAEQSQSVTDQNPKTLIMVKSYLDVTSGSGNSFSCRLGSERLNRTVSTVFSVPVEFYPRTSGWLYAFLLILFGTIALIIGLILFFRREQRRTRTLSFRPTTKVYQEAETRNTLLEMELDAKQVELDQIRHLSITAFQRMKDNAVDVTLDDDSANPNLEISSEHTMARCAQGREIPTDMSRRFVSRLSVLGKEEFTGGRHFWMVEVDKQLRWDLGVARESVDREGKPALNPENGYWTIGHDGQNYWANDTSRLEISLKGKLQMIGIYVNYDAGQVVICDAATRAHLHSFTGCFEGTICPFFNLSESGKVSIFQSTSLPKQPNSA